MVTLYLVRHGETEGNVAQILQGHMPGRLTARGRLQAAGLRERLLAEGIVPDVLLTSDLQRAVDTAAIINEAYGLPVTLCPLLRERDWGELTGRAIGTVDTAHFPPSVEKIETLAARAGRFLDLLRDEYTGRCVLAVTHGLFARCVQAVATGRTLREVPRMNNAEVRRVDVAEGPVAAAPATATDEVSDR